MGRSTDFDPADDQRQRRGPRVRFVSISPAATPRLGTTVGITLGVLASLAPGLLPRTPSAQAILSGLLAVIGLALAGLVRFTLRRCGVHVDAVTARWRQPTLLVAVVATGGAVGYAEHWQTRLRDAMGVAQVGAEYWLWWLLGTALIVGAAVGLAHGIHWLVRRMGRLRSAVLGVLLVVATQGVAVPAVVQWRQDAYAAANAAVDPAVRQPISAARSGSPVSTVSWPSLGAQGRRFVAGTPARAVRVYVGLDSAPDLNSRVALAIRELERSGGLRRSHLVVTVPTGSGWIDAEAAAGLDDRFDGDVALVGLQYSAAPSWATFVFGRAAAERSARAVFTAIEQRLSALPHPPKLYVYGQSLGALGGSAIFPDDADQDRRTCAVLWAGPPAGAVNRGGATVLANASDPVVHWSPALLWRPANLTDTRPDAPVPPWLPVVSFLQTTADLLAALDAPTGHGHRYGPDQGTRLGTC
ncbi:MULTISPECIES: alpha/beta-hydrolase family protein [unclassified Nocardia]|uniref:alpha/beta-hydrolase family protein n=1 Tax=unclassified Nocardia TaxID=2637762 RepID=UPI0024A9CF45|nr:MULTISPECIES: alpha/beta-hydrolase family protein [unclassified Nocardia]